MQNQGKPFSALASAFDGYCDKLVEEGWRGIQQRVSSKLKEVLGTDAFYLERVIPSLSKIIGQDACRQNILDQDCVNAQRRLQYLLCQFMKVIAGSSAGMSIILFIDDLQCK